ncbi:hypothetical protein P6166_04710 [Stenotrophomonas sp. HITSZ_GD]|uniref:hypothetical protein n=1 Tax=Stenotrophomonas sp. HITSZ_GD TaxID=3037248 RepID=UPI00240D620B|nr:hypothetical protein [Stenotrophomonas sp. HITSZ_GD]MDG2524659.1 hypothetical protein [Stenotrophomonas sp. HITSZ_GD]
MALTRDQLQVHLDQLEGSVPGLVDTQEHHFIEAFAAMVETIADAAGPGADRDWVEHQALGMLARHGLIPPIDEAA